MSPYELVLCVGSAQVLTTGWSGWAPYRFLRTGSGRSGRKDRKTGNGKGIHKKAIQMVPHSPQARAWEVAGKCLEDASKARTQMENMSGVQMTESINVTLGDHATYFTASYHNVTKLVQSNVEDDADYEEDADYS